MMTQTVQSIIVSILTTKGFTTRFGAARRGAARRHTVIFSLIVTVLVLYHIMIIAIIDYLLEII